MKNNFRFPQITGFPYYDGIVDSPEDRTIFIWGGNMRCDNKLCIWVDPANERCTTSPYIVNCHCVTYRRRQDTDTDRRTDLIHGPVKPFRKGDRVTAVAK